MIRFDDVVELQLVHFIIEDFFAHVDEHKVFDFKLVGGFFADLDDVGCRIELSVFFLLVHTIKLIRIKTIKA